MLAVFHFDVVSYEHETSIAHEISLHNLLKNKIISYCYFIIFLFSLTYQRMDIS